MKSKYYLIMLLAFVNCFTASVQGLDASPAGVMISHGHPKGGWMFSYSCMNMMMQNNLSGTLNIPDDEIIAHDYSMSPQKMNMYVLMAMYGRTGRLSAMVMVNYKEQTMDMTAYSATIHMYGGSMDMSSTSHSHLTSGLSDEKLWALSRLLIGKNSSLAASLGFSFPTGEFKIETGEHEPLKTNTMPT